MSNLTCSSTYIGKDRKEKKSRLHDLTVARSSQRRDQGLVNPAKGNTELKCFISPLGIHNLELCYKCEHLLRKKGIFLAEKFCVLAGGGSFFLRK